MKDTVAMVTMAIFIQFYLFIYACHTFLMTKQINLVAHILLSEHEMQKMV